MRDWLATLHAVLAAGPVVRVVVAAVRGSAPREEGASMLVTATGEIGTIGGGHLELVATNIAREMLASSEAPARQDRFNLAASLGQCCGGIVDLAFERYDAADAGRITEALRLRDAGASVERIAALACRDPRAGRYENFFPDVTPLWLFGAGHVGRALVHVLDTLPFRITWVDSREDALDLGSRAIAAAAAPGMTSHVTPAAAAPPGMTSHVTPAAAAPSGMTRHVTPAAAAAPGMTRDVTPAAAIAAMGRGPSPLHAPFPADVVADMPAGAFALVMTHSHDEDLALCEALLRDGRFSWAGVIGSQPKTNRFRQKLAQRGLDASRLAMPIGVGGITSKEPAVIAVSVAAQLLQVRESRLAIATPGKAATRP